jgi:hypothetical protein
MMDGVPGAGCRGPLEPARVDGFVDFVIGAAEDGDGVFGPRSDILETLMALLGVSSSPGAPADRWGLREAWAASLEPLGPRRRRVRRAASPGPDRRPREETAGRA